MDISKMTFDELVANCEPGELKDERNRILDKMHKNSTMENRERNSLIERSEVLRKAADQRFNNKIDDIIS